MIAVHCLLGTAVLLYAAASVAFIAWLVQPSQRWATLASVLLTTGWGVHLGKVVVHWVITGNPPYGLSLLALLMVGGHLLAQLRWRQPALGVFVAPLIFVFSLLALASGSYDFSELPATLQGAWLPVHVLLALLGNAAFALSLGAALVYLIQETLLKRKRLGGIFQRLPPLQTLDTINHRLVAAGFVLLTLALMTGAIYAKQVWGQYWSWSLKEISTAVIWGIFFAALHARYLRGWRGRRAAWVTVTGSVLVLSSFIASAVFELGRHSGSFQ